MKFYKRTFAKKSEYKGIVFDSKMEMDFAKYLDGMLISYKGIQIRHGPIKWERSKSFELIPRETWIDRTERDCSVKTLRNKKRVLPKVVYTPDFYLPEYNLYVETKGYQFDDSVFRLRLRVFKHFYPNVNICIITSHSEFNKIDKIIENLKIGE